MMRQIFYKFDDFLFNGLSLYLKILIIQSIISTIYYGISTKNVTLLVLFAFVFLATVIGYIMTDKHVARLPSASLAGLGYGICYIPVIFIGAILIILSVFVDLWSIVYSIRLILNGSQKIIQYIFLSMWILPYIIGALLRKLSTFLLLRDLAADKAKDEKSI